MPRDLGSTKVLFNGHWEMNLVEKKDKTQGGILGYWLGWMMDAQMELSLAAWTAAMMAAYLVEYMAAMKVFW